MTRLIRSFWQFRRRKDDHVPPLDVVEHLEDHHPLVLMEAGLHAPSPDLVSLGYINLEEEGD
jgi:hypothetical protein